MESEVVNSALQFTVAQERRAAVRTLAKHAADTAELALFLDMLDLRDPDDHRPGQDMSLQSFNIML